MEDLIQEHLPMMELLSEPKCLKILMGLGLIAHELIHFEQNVEGKILY
jgi:hypothetical protein